MFLWLRICSDSNTVSFQKRLEAMRAMWQYACCWYPPVCNTLYYATLIPFSMCSLPYEHLIFVVCILVLDIEWDDHSRWYCWVSIRVFDGVMTKLHNLKANDAGRMLVSCHSNYLHLSHRLSSMKFIFYCRHGRKNIHLSG